MPLGRCVFVLCQACTFPHSFLGVPVCRHLLPTPQKRPARFFSRLPGLDFSILTSGPVRRSFGTLVPPPPPDVETHDVDTVPLWSVPPQNILKRTKEQTKEEQTASKALDSVSKVSQSGSTREGTEVSVIGWVEDSGCSVIRGMSYRVGCEDK